MRHTRLSLVVLVVSLLAPGCAVENAGSCEVTPSEDGCELTPDQVAACKLILEDVIPLEASRGTADTSTSVIYVQVRDCEHPLALLEAVELAGYEFLPAASYEPDLGLLVRFDTFECLSPSELKVERWSAFMSDTWLLQLSDGQWEIKDHQVRLLK